MATTTNYGWTTPDDTALVKDGAAAIRTLGSSVDTTTKALNPSTTLGDIEYRSATANTNTRLGIGSTGNVLTVSGGVPVWAAPAGGGGKSFSLLSTNTITTGVATYTVSGITGVDDLIIVVEAARSSTASTFFSMAFSGAGSANAASVNISNPSSYATTIVGASSVGSVTIANTSSNTNSSVQACIQVTGISTTGIKSFISTGAASDASGNGQIARIQSGILNKTAAITSITLTCGAGNFDAGTIYLYGAA